MGTNRNIFLVTQNLNYKIGLVDGDIKYIIDLFSYESEMYNLTEDPSKQNNLVSENNSYQYYQKILWAWYNCQTDYYGNKRWKEGKRIECG
ncbi:MAG: hypothetical protein Q8N88_01740 [Nanoarchaeota archaeon]|nr:hypothetical protein [Nanoarchaeota archaeon]